MKSYDELFRKMQIAEEQGISDFSYVDENGVTVTVRVAKIDPNRYYDYLAKT